MFLFWGGGSGGLGVGGGGEGITNSFGLHRCKGLLLELHPVGKGNFSNVGACRRFRVAFGFT